MRHFPGDAGDSGGDLMNKSTRIYNSISGACVMVTLVLQNFALRELPQYPFT